MTPQSDQTKSHTRRQCRAQRDALEADFRLQASRTICKHIQEWGIFRGADIIQVYLSMRSEVDLTPLLEEHPEKQWVIPRILPEGRMIFHAHDPVRLVPHAFGMVEPDPDLPVVDPASIHLALVPGLAFDRQGWRLGYGGGYFDRFLRNFRGVSLGITYEALLRESLPHETHDIPVQYLVSESGLIPTLRP